MNSYNEVRALRNLNPRPNRDAELVAIPAVRAIRRRVAVSPTIAVVIASLIGFKLEAR
jgi:hypothetical protein